MDDSTGVDKTVSYKIQIQGRDPINTIIFVSKKVERDIQVDCEFEIPAGRIYSEAGIVGKYKIVRILRKEKEMILRIQ